MRLHWPPLIVLLSAVVALPATVLRAAPAQSDAIHWHSDLESAKVVAKESGRLVLVHFWATTCGPCMALEQNVFNQPGVASAIETQFVPVKLNADENSATAQWYGITRVPMDVIITPDGQIVGKLISPPTPAAYVAEVTAAAGKYTNRSGGAFAKAAAAAPMPSQLNGAYANLPVSPDAPLAIPSQVNTQLPPASSAPMRVAEIPGTPGKHHKSGLAGGPFQQAAPQSVMNPAAANPVANPSITNSGFGAGVQPNPAAFAMPAAAPNQVTNPYASTTAPAPTYPQTPASPFGAPAQPAPTTVADSTLRINSAAAGMGPAAVPPAAAAGAMVPPFAASAAAPNGGPDTRQLPAGAPPLCFEGYCAVSMRNQWKWIPGDPRFAVVHRGHTFWFASAEEQKQFWTDPDRYTPALAGMDPVMAIDHQQQVPGKREHSLDYDGLFYMFASEATLQQFTANPQRYSAGVRQAMGIPRGRLVR